MIHITKLFNAMPKTLQSKVSLSELRSTVENYNNLPETKDCPDCAHERPGEIKRCEGVYSLCPTCHGKGYLDGSEHEGTNFGRALMNLGLTKIQTEAQQEG